MKKLIISALALCAVSTSADFNKINISSFTGNYKKPDGSATATELNIPKNMSSEINIELKGVENGYLLQYGENEYHFENPPAFIDNIESANWRNINYSTISTTMKTSVESFKSDIAGSYTDLRGFSGSCKFNRDHNDQYGLQILDACLTNSSFKISYLQSVKLALMQEIFIEVPGLQGVLSNQTILKNASISISSNSFSFSGKVDMGMSANVKISGTSELESDRVKIKIDKAKASFFNIKNKLFDELEKSETEKFRVQNPYIYIYLK